MQDPSLEDIEALMTGLALPFYLIERNAIVTVGPRRFENDVEHSWSVAFLACSLAPEVDKSLKAHAHPKIGGYYEQLLELFEKHPEYFSQNETQA